MKISNKHKGNISEARLFTAFIERGCTVSLPYGENQVYDLVVDFGDGSLKKVQVKTGRLLRSGSLEFKTGSSYFHHKHSKVRTRTVRSKVDYFGVYSPDLKRAYLVPAQVILGDRTCTLRVRKSKNGQRKGVMVAKKYMYYDFSS